MGITRRIRDGPIGPSTREFFEDLFMDLDNLEV